MLGLTVLALVLTGCSASSSRPSGPDARPSVPSPSTAPAPAAPLAADDSGGMGVPQLGRGEAPDRTRPLRIRVEVSGRGCFLARPADRDREPLLVVWPPRTTLGDAGDKLVLDSGVTATDGALLPGRGAVVPVRSLPSYAEDGYWAYAIDYCTPEARRVLVLTEVDPR